MREMTIDEILEGLEQIALSGVRKYGADNKNVKVILEARDAILALRDERRNVYSEVRAFMDLLETFAEWKAKP
jgi:hypothetical protein